MERRKKMAGKEKVERNERSLTRKREWRGVEEDND